MKKPKVREVFPDEKIGWKYTIYDTPKHFFTALGLLIAVIIIALILSSLYKHNLVKIDAEPTAYIVPTKVISTKPKESIEQLSTIISDPVELESQIITNEPKETVEGLELPTATDGSKKTVEGFDKIKREGSAQLELQKHAYTDADGFRKIGIWYMIALATFYAKYIGQKFIIEFADGTQLNCIVGDVKADKHTDSKNQYHLCDKSIVEFIVDTEIMQLNDASPLIGEGAVVRIWEVEE